MYETFKNNNITYFFSFGQGVLINAYNPNTVEHKGGGSLDCARTKQNNKVSLKHILTACHLPHFLTVTDYHVSYD